MFGAATYTQEGRDLPDTFHLSAQALLPVTALDRQPIVNRVNRFVGSAMRMVAMTEETSASYTILFEFMEELATWAIYHDLDLFEPGMPKAPVDIDLEDLYELVACHDLGSYIESAYAEMTDMTRTTADMSVAILTTFGAEALCAPTADIESMMNSFSPPLFRHHTTRLQAGIIITAALLGKPGTQNCIESDDGT